MTFKILYVIITILRPNETQTMIKDNDKVIIAIDNGRELRTEIFDFKGLKPGSPIRASRVSEYERFLEALIGQGCKIGVWSVEYWNKVKSGVLSGKIKLK